LENTYLKLDANGKVKSVRRGPYWRADGEKIIGEKGKDCNGIVIAVVCSMSSTARVYADVNTCSFKESVLPQYPVLHSGELIERT